MAPSPTLTCLLVVSLGVLCCAVSGITVSDKERTTKEATQELKILTSHRVRYSSPPVDTDYRSNPRFNARGMQYVYVITHLFLDLVQRDNVFPESLNASVLLDTPAEEVPSVLQEHWTEILLQYIGVVTVAVCGLLLALCIPVACFCMCCCRCAGKCGAYPEHFDKKSDSCKRFTLGVFLAILIIMAMFGVVCAFVTNYYFYQGTDKLPSRLQAASDDTSKYLDNTGKEVNSILVTNFNELEEVLGGILDDSGPIIKKSLAEVTQAAAIDDLTHIVSNLGTVKRYLKDIQNKTLVLQTRADQLKLGLNGTRSRLLQALKQCNDNKLCKEFLDEFDIGRDLAIAANFDAVPESLPDLSVLMKDIGGLMDNDIERKVRGGKEQLDQVKKDIERSIVDIRPKIKNEIRRMGRQLQDQADEIQGYLNEFDSSVATVHMDIPRIQPVLDEHGQFLFYIGLGMSFMLLLILLAHIFGLFYGFCGKRPGNVYGDDCCNTGTGANWLLAAVYLTFLFSCVLLLLATAQFLIGSTVDKVACEALQSPNESEVFRLLDERLIQPHLRGRHPDETWSMSLGDIIYNCHSNKTIYEIMHMQDIYDVTELRNWRENYDIGGFIDKLKANIKLNDLRNIQILSPEAEKELQELAESDISDLNFGQYTRLADERITAINLSSFIRRLRQVRQNLSQRQARLVGPAIDNEVLFLDSMQRVVMDMKLAMKDLANSVEALEKEAKHSTPNLREALRALIAQATAATAFLRKEGPELVNTLTDQYVNETVGLIDEYVERVINHTQSQVGRCEPLSVSYNATVIAVCNEIVDPFNGFWTSVGWCLMLFLPAVVLSMSLVGLYRKSEPYPGPLVETVPVTSQRENAREESSHNKKKRRGHRRNPSEYLPDSAHYRAGYSYQSGQPSTSGSNRFSDMAPRNYGESGAAPSVQPQPSTSTGVTPAGGPPRYSSNPSLDRGAGPGAPPAEYERPPPYYYPGSAPAGAAPPPLPAPNRQ